MAGLVRVLDMDIGRILDALGDREDDTVVLFFSDNGFLYGEHRLAGKAVTYEESIRVPFAVRFPRLVRSPRVSDALVGNVDLAPTITDLAGIPWAADGRSLRPILEGRSSAVRDAFLVEWCQADRRRCERQSAEEGRRFRSAAVPPAYWGVVTDRFVYVAYDTGAEELYDLERDPFELRNLARDPGSAAVLARLHARLAELRAPPDEPETTIAVGPEGPGAPRTVWFEYFSQELGTRFRCRLGRGRPAGAWRPCDGGRLSYRDLAPGSYVFEVRAVDVRGRADPTPAERSFTVGP
jgi:arylsulfatase A-like enzyme